DVYVVNTCSVTARADATARKAIRRLHQEHPQAQIVATGCYAQRAPEELAELPGVALVSGAADRERIASTVQEIEPGSVRIEVSPIEQAVKFLDVPISEMMEHSRAFVKVQEGCNESCSFCIVPQTRGASRSREPQSVLAQVHALVAAGYVEIVLTGVHVGDYGLDLAAGRRMLSDLIVSILDVSGVRRLRLSSIEPSTITDEIVELVANEPRFARHFHIPFQSGSNAVLERMRRRYTVEAFAERVCHIADRVPDCAIGTDVICGFPGETEADFQQTFDTLVALPVTHLHPFTYSVRPGSDAERFGDRIPGEVKKRRANALKRMMRDKNLAFRRMHVGRTMPVLVESARRGSSTALAGWTDNYLRVALSDTHYEDAIEPVKIVGVTENGLLGERLLLADAVR
ncbi:MAG: tRNA (N(6)-L-threonylcarbamoyladenosine(37)-C(2))-methylthiotransferase MtaB, partial [Gammaproteobacteria bacterium]